MKTRTLIATALLGLTLTACGTTWTKPGLTAEEWQRDDYRCEIQSRTAVGGYAASGIITQEVYAKKYKEMCLAANGYTRIK